MFLNQQVKTIFMVDHLAFQVNRLQDEVKFVAFGASSRVEQGEQAHEYVMRPRCVFPRVILNLDQALYVLRTNIHA